MELGQIIAENLRHEREQKGLSLGELSKQSGVSKGVLAEIEKGQSNPTINTLMKIANALNIHYTSLTEDTKHEARIIRKKDALEKISGTEHYRICCYYPSTPIRNFEIYYAELDSASENTSVGHLGRAEDYIFILKGTLILETAGQKYELRSGDSIYFDASYEHTYRNEGKTLVSMLIINYYS